MPIYETLGTTVTVQGGGSIPPSALNTSVAIVGEGDLANGTATAGESATVTSTSDADEQFGADSELARAVSALKSNGVGTIYGVPVPETEATESFTASSTGTLTNTPLFDPRVTTKSITVTDTGGGTDPTVEVVFGSPATSPDADTVEVNPRTGEWSADASSDYDISYTHGDHDAALDVAVDQPARYVVVGTEADSVKSTLQTKLAEAAQNFRFLRGVAGARPNIQSGEVSSYTPTTDDQRVVEVAPARATGGDGAVRTAHAVTRALATSPVDVTGSITYDTVRGLIDLNVAYTPTTATSFERVTTLTDQREVAEGLTTSSTAAFADIYKVEIVDLIVEQVHERLKNYRGGPNTRDAQRRLASRLKRTLAAQSVPVAQPPLLAAGDGTRPYSVAVSTGTSDEETDVDIGIDPAPIAKQVDVDIETGPIRFGGAEVNN